MTCFLRSRGARRSRGALPGPGRRALAPFALAAALAVAAEPVVTGPSGAASAQVRTSAAGGDAAPGRRPITLVGASPRAPGPSGRAEYPIGTLTAGSIDVDGVLDEPGWASAVVIPIAYEVRPAENQAAPVATECRLAYDRDNLYLGCVAADPEPGAIRAYVVDRDGIDAHDRIVLTLDPFNDQRRAFQFGVSALGVQSDAVMAQQGAANPNQGPGAAPVDPSWDAIWSSAGTIGEDGYVVEAAIPFRSLRFPEARDGASWGAYITRWWPRNANVELRSTPWDRADSCLLCQADLVTGLRGVSPGANLQVTPTLTGSRESERAGARPAPLTAADPTGDVGLDVQWGPTTDLTLNLTANPDFSQVEADVAQLDVNNRFALFFPEKRPFFLEGADFFGTPIQAVFTRSIADPVAGAKVTGKLGANGLGALVARDRSTTLLIPGSEGSSTATLDAPVTTGIARFRRDVGSTSTVGALYTGREGADYSNRVGGVDAFYRPVSSLTVQAQVLRSRTEYPTAVAEEEGQEAGAFDGLAGQVQAVWNTRRWQLFAFARQIDEGFRADAGFLTQAGMRGGNVNLIHRLLGDSDRWFSEIRFVGGVWNNRDFHGNQLNGGLWFGLEYDGPGQTSFGIWPNVFMREHFADVTYDDLDQLWFFARSEPSGALSLGLDGNLGDGVDFANERLGFEWSLSPSVTLRMGRNTEASLRHTRRALDFAGEQVFVADLSQLRAVYNFSARSYLRAILQYRRTQRATALYVDEVDPESTSLLAQVLYAYKVNPQTVLFLGYGEDGDGRIGPDMTRLPLETRARVLFLKLGYAWRP